MGKVLKYILRQYANASQNGSWKRNRGLLPFQVDYVNKAC
jgi:hypothetical protein